MRYANLQHAKLLSADLGYTNLSYADFSGASLDCANLSVAKLCYASLCYTSFKKANLDYAYLDNTDLSTINLIHVIGNLKHIKTFQTDIYFVAYTAKHIQIGCEKHTIEEWYNFNDKTIEKMSKDALSWWTRWKPIIKKMIELSPCEDTTSNYSTVA